MKTKELNVNVNENNIKEGVAMNSRRKAKKQIFKMLFVVYSGYSHDDEHNLSDYDFLPPQFNRPINELFDYLLVNFPTFYSKYELQNLFDEIKNYFPEYKGELNPVVFFEHATTFRLDYNFAFCDLYLLADYLYTIWDDNVVAVLDNYAVGMSDALKDKDLRPVIKTWDATYNDVDNFMSKFKYKILFEY